MHISPEILEKLVKKYGPTIDIVAKPWILENILEDIRQPGHPFHIPKHKFGDVSPISQTHDKTYTKDVEGGGTYGKYDRTLSGHGSSVLGDWVGEYAKTEEPPPYDKAEPGSHPSLHPGLQPGSHPSLHPGLQPGHGPDTTPFSRHDDLNSNKKKHKGE